MFVVPVKNRSSVQGNIGAHSEAEKIRYSDFVNKSEPCGREWNVMRKRRESGQKTQLSRFLTDLLEKEKKTIREAARIAGCSPSVLSDWKHGGYPSTPESMEYLRKLCSHYKYSLSFALTGHAETAVTEPNLSAHFIEELAFSGLAKIQITRLIPRNGKKSE